MNDGNGYARSHNAQAAAQFSRRAAPSAPPSRHATPPIDWMSLYGAFWRDLFDVLETLLKRMGQCPNPAPRVPSSSSGVMLGKRLWHDRFGGDPRAVGRLLRLGGESYEVVGVLPRGVRLPGGDPDLLAPLAFGPAESPGRVIHAVEALAKQRAFVAPRQREAAGL